MNSPETARGSAVWWLIGPALIFVTLTFALPVILTLSESLRVGSAITLENYRAFFSDELNLEVLWRTVRISALATLVSAVVCYPAALAASRVNPKYRGVLMGLIILPLMTSSVARTYTWLILLGRGGMVNAALVGVGVLREPVQMLFTEGAVFVGLLQLFMPLMLISLVSAMENLPKDALHAARSLGANEWQVFTRVIAPLTREGLVVGGTLVFTGCMTAYVTPALLGGPKVTVLATLLYQKASVSVDFGAASVIAVVMLATTLLVNALLRGRAGRRAPKALVAG